MILNPSAGRAAEREVRELLAGAAEIRPTTGPGAAEGLARNALEEGFHTIVAAGGDGTLNEVINGLLPDPGDAVCGLLPLGTGNDFARTVGIPAGLEAAWKIVLERRIQSVDVVESIAEGSRRWLVNMAVGGDVDRVGEKVSPESKQSWGPLAYLKATAETLAELEPYEVEVRFDDEDETIEAAVHSVVVANGRTLAGGIPIAPRAVVDDGLLDCLLITDVGGLDIASLGAKVLLGRHLEGGDERLVFRRCRVVELVAEPPMPFHIDGELLPPGPVRFELRPRALPMIVGADAATES